MKKAESANATKKRTKDKVEKVAAGEKQPKTSQPTKTERAFAVLGGQNVSFFHDEKHEPYVLFPQGTHFEIAPVASRQFKRWLSKVHYEQAKATIPQNALRDYLLMCEAQAVFSGPQFSLENRVARYDKAFWFDLTDADWRRVRIDENGWEVVEASKVPLFHRYSHQEPAVVAPKGNVQDIFLLRKYVPVNPEEEKLFFPSLCTLLIPDVPHAIIVVYGAQGSAKSTAFEFIRSVFDPSLIKKISFPKEANELLQMLSHHYLFPVDNLTNLSEWQSNILCRASTGEGFSKRMLYTDEDDVIFQFKRAIMLNGINCVARHADLLDRCVLFEFQRISLSKFKQMSELKAEFEQDRPKILAAVFTIFSKAITIYRSLSINNLPRMADFAMWGEAFSQAMGYPANSFIEAYRRNSSKQVQETIEADIVAQLLSIYFRDSTSWEGSPTDLHKFLTEFAGLCNIDLKNMNFPRAPNALTRRMNVLKATLAEVGITFESTGDGRGGRVIKISKDEPVKTDNSERPTVGEGDAIVDSENETDNDTDKENTEGEGGIGDIGDVSPTATDADEFV